MPPRFLCRSTVWVVTVSLLFTCYEAAPPRVDTKYPAISKMTANSHPMLASVFNAANTASLQLVQTPSKNIGVKKIKDLPDIGGAGVKPEFIGIGASLLCRLCQLEKDLKCIERHCWNDGSVAGVQSSFAGPILVETTQNQHGNVEHQSSAVKKLPDQLKSGGQINIPQTNTVNFGVALPPALFASVAEPPARTASLIIPSKVSSQVIVSQEKKQYTSGMPTLFSDFMSMDKYKGQKTAEYVPSALSESVVDKLTGVTTKVENLKEVRPGVIAPVDKSANYVPSNIGNLEQMLNQMMGSRPLLPITGTGSVDSQPGRTFDASSHVGNIPVDHKVIDVQATDIAPSFPRASGEVLGRAQGNVVQGSNIDFGGMQEPAASMTLHPFDSSMTGVQSTHLVESVPSALSTGELLGPVTSHTDQSLAIVAAAGQQSSPRAVLLDNMVGSNIALERLQQSSHIPTAADTQFQMFDSRTDVQGNPNAHPVVFNSADMHSTGMLLGPVQSHMEQSQNIAAGTRQPHENMPTTFNEPTMVGQSTQNIQPERQVLSSSVDIRQGLAENSGQMLGQAHGQMAQGSQAALEPVQQVELAPLSHFQLDTPVMGGQGTRNIQPIVSMGEPQIFLHNNQNANHVGNVGGPEVVARNTGSAQQVNTEIHPQMSGQGTGNVRQVASAGKPELFAREQQGAAAGVSEFETTTFPTFEVETMSPQRKAQLREVSKLFLPAMAFNQK